MLRISAAQISARRFDVAFRFVKSFRISIKYQSGEGSTEVIETAFVVIISKTLNKNNSLQVLWGQALSRKKGLAGLGAAPQYNRIVKQIGAPDEAPICFIQSKNLLLP
jgi:hypothetical protein